MTTYNTHNPLGSQDPRDLFDNAQNMDSAVNSQTAEEWIDRLGKPRKTWHGIEKTAKLDIAQAVSEATVEAGSYRDQAQVARDDAIAAAAASGPLKFYVTYAQAEADRANIPLDGLVEIARDETKNGARTRYFNRVSGLDFAVNLDQLRLDLIDPAMGAMIVAFLDGRTVKDKLLDEINIKDYGDVGNGQIADAALAAAIAAANGPGLIRFPAGNYVFTSKKTLTSANIGLRFVGDGERTTIITKQFNGDLFELDACPYHSVSEMTLDGQYGTYTGRAALVKANSHYPRYENFTTKGFSGEHIAFEANAGFGSGVNNHTALAGSDQGAIVGLKLLGKDTGYSVRRITNPNYAGSIDLAAGCDNVFITSGQVTKVDTSNDCGHLFIQGVRWGNAGVRVDIYGNTFVTGCSFAQSVRLMPGWDGVFVGNRQDGGSAPYFENLAFSGLVYHSAPDGSTFLAKASLIANMPGSIEVAGVNSVGDTDYTFNPTASPTHLIFDTAFSANRSISLPTLNVAYGQKLRITRSAANVGGPWTLEVGSTGKTMVYNTWCDLIFNGSFWAVTASGNI